MPFDRRLIAFALFAAALAVMVWALVRYQGRAPGLETQTFELQHLEPHQARDLIRPYVWEDRPGAAGTMSAVDNTISVRETEDNLERIARVLEEFDVPRPTVRLNFQLIEADGAAQGDPAIADVEAELRRLFRYDGYRLVNEAVVGGMEGSHIEQVVGRDDDAEAGWIIIASIGSVRVRDDSGWVQMEVGVRSPMRGAFMTRVNARIGQTMVVGNAQLMTGGGTLILTVRPEIVRN
jgi:hypothetical protein